MRDSSTIRRTQRRSFTPISTKVDSHNECSMILKAKNSNSRPNSQYALSVLLYHCRHDRASFYCNSICPVWLSTVHLSNASLTFACLTDAGRSPILINIGSLHIVWKEPIKPTNAAQIRMVSCKVVNLGCIMRTSSKTIYLHVWPLFGSVVNITPHKLLITWSIDICVPMILGAEQKSSLHIRCHWQSLARKSE